MPLPIAYFIDARLTMGETVLTSIVVDMTQPRPRHSMHFPVGGTHVS